MRYSCKMPVQIDPILLAAVRCFPKQVGPKEQLAKAYDRLGDLRGEYIRNHIQLNALKQNTQINAESLNQWTQLRQRNKELFMEYELEWLDDWGLTTANVTWEGGMPATVALGWDIVYEQSSDFLSEVPFQALAIQGEHHSIHRFAKLEFLQHCLSLDLSRTKLTRHAIQEISKCVYLNNLQVLNVGFNSFFNWGPEYIAKSPIFSNLLSLDMHDNRIDRSGVQWMVGSKYLKKLRHLNLSKNPVNSGIRRLFNWSVLPELETLNVNQCGLSDTDLATTIAGCKNIVTLDIGSNFVGDETLKQIRSGEHLASLKNLSLRSVGLNTRNLVTVLQPHTMPQLEVLDLRQNELDVSSVIFFENACKNRDLSELHLTYIGCSESDLNAWFQNGLLKGQSHLDFSFCRFSETVLPSIVSSPSATQLTELNLQYNELSPRTIELLAESEMLTRLESLNLCGINIEEQGVRSIISSVRLPKLRELNLSRMGEVFANVDWLIESTLVKNLDCIQLSRYNFTNDAIEKLQTALAHLRFVS